MNILLVENNHIIRKTTRDWLVDDGHSVDLYLPERMPSITPEVTSRKNTSALVALARAYDALILDRETFGIDGKRFIAAVEILRVADYTGKLIATTTLGLFAQPEKEKFGNYIRWLEKPYRMRLLEAELKRK